MQRNLLRAASALNVWAYRMSGGKLMGRFPSGAPVCLLTTKGAKSGQRRTVPLLYLEDQGDYVVVASQGGAPQHPGWYFNLQANPTAEVEIGRRRIRVTAQRVSDQERDRLWPRLVAIYPPYETYRTRTARTIPVLRLSPVPV